MKAKLLFLFILSLFPIRYKKETLTDYMGIKGEVTMVDASSNIPITLSLVSGHPYSGVRVDVYVNSVKKKTFDTISKYIDKDEYYIPALYKNNQHVSVKIDVYYIDKPSLCSSVTFDYYSPAYSEYRYFINSKYRSIYVDNTLKTSFYMKGSTTTISYDKEIVSYKGINSYYVSNNRYVDFSSFYFSYKGISDLDIDCCELRLYYKFEDSDLLYKKKLGYTSIELPLRYDSTQTYNIENEFMFYMNKQNGAINENNSSETYSDLLPFYIPLSVKKGENIKFELVFDDVGENHSSYIFQGIIIVEQDYESDQYGYFIDYAYKEIDTPLKGVKYE